MRKLKLHHLVVKLACQVLGATDRAAATASNDVIRIAVRNRAEIAAANARAEALASRPASNLKVAPQWKGWYRLRR